MRNSTQVPILVINQAFYYKFFVYFYEGPLDNLCSDVGFLLNIVLNYHYSVQKQGTFGIIHILVCDWFT